MQVLLGRLRRTIEECSKPTLNPSVIPTMNNCTSGWLGWSNRYSPHVAEIDGMCNWHGSCEVSGQFLRWTSHCTSHVSYSITEAGSSILLIIWKSVRGTARKYVYVSGIRASVSKNVLYTLLQLYSLVCMLKCSSFIFKVFCGSNKLMYPACLCTREIPFLFVCILINLAS